ncbi:DoxX family protein [Inquilinus sp. CA228]|uniref:DoxX family protein n=1 Tax=Inquilinus sp. CA228 TaxID=3455609 RepID=UPI003F8D80A7
MMQTPLLDRISSGSTILLRTVWVGLAARIAVAAPFLVSGMLKLLDFDGAIGEVRGLTGVEPAAVLAVLVIFTQLAGSALLIMGGRWSWMGAGTLAGFTVTATLLAHAFWMKSGADRMRDLNTFFEHVSIVGGLVLVAALTSGARSEKRRR